MTTHHGDARRGVSVRSYRTNFELDEDPVSEGGIWLNGGANGLDWVNVVTRNGLAHGAATTVMHSPAVDAAAPLDQYGHHSALYDDPTALLKGEWGRNQYAKARVFSRNQTEKCFQEVELRLRSTITPHACTGYEVFWSCRKTESAYAYIARWNGKQQDWTQLGLLTGAQFGVKDGDLVEATIVDNVIRSYINGVEVMTVTDDTFDSGSPGIGFNFGCGNTYVDHGFTHFEVDSWNS